MTKVIENPQERDIIGKVRVFSNDHLKRGNVLVITNNYNNSNSYHILENHTTKIVGLLHGRYEEVHAKDMNDVLKYKVIAPDYGASENYETHHITLDELTESVERFKLVLGDVITVKTMFKDFPVFTGAVTATTQDVTPSNPDIITITGNDTSLRLMPTDFAKGNAVVTKLIR